jgi:transposase
MIYAGFESTGGYENNWYQLLWKLQDGFQIQVARLNPFGVKYHKKASLDRIETDKLSARKIAEYLIAYPDKVEYSKEDYFAGLRRHWKYIRMLTKQKSQLKNTLKAQLYVAHPQLLIHCVDDVSNWILHLLIKYPTAARLSTANPKALSQIPYISKQRAKELVSEAIKSVASIEDQSMENLIKSAAHQILHLKKEIKRQIELMKVSFDFPEIEILISFVGINDYSAFGLLLEIVAVERYASVKKLASFFGMHPAFRESGDGIWGMHMSKKGRKEPRWILFNVARCAVAHNEMIKQLYEGYLSRGKTKMSALGIMMHKILRIVYGMLKHKKKYDPTIDRANRKKKKKGKNRKKVNAQEGNNKVDKTRRYQFYDKSAPVSKRQSKKRKLELKELKEVVINQSGKNKNSIIERRTPDKRIN